MPSPFPGMDPYLEQPGLWEEVHTDLITHIRQFLTSLLRPRYRVAIEQRTYLDILPPDEQLTGKSDVLVTGPNQPAGGGGMAVLEAIVAPIMGQLPQTEAIKHRHLTLRRVSNNEVITVIEILSPANKRPGKGRRQYEEKRLKVLESLTNLVEIDLLRAHEPMPMYVDIASHYRIVISRSHRRPSAHFYLFNLPQAIPDFPIPLQPDEEEPMLKLNQILHTLYDQGGYDLAINYARTPPPPVFAEVELTWMRDLINET